VLVTHDASLTSRADRIVTVRDGKIVADEICEPAGAAR
jgi:predicted ABC-type transport system involved in lysophospholipase L1 biosynthesis ATPase subunit